MSTAFTAKLEKGEQSFQEFVFTCARAFYFYIHLRDVELNADLPSMKEVWGPELERIKERLERATKAAAQFVATPDESVLQDQRREHKRRVAEWETSRSEYLIRIARFRKMKDEIEKRSWPNELSELKKFMLQQLGFELGKDGKGSLFEYYSKEPEMIPLQEYRKRHLTYLLHEVERAKEDVEHVEEDIKKGEVWRKAIKRMVEEG